MTDKILLLKQTLSRHGASLTRPRLLVFRALDQAEPQSMNSLTQALEGQLDRASLYRTISLFEELGIVNRINIGFKHKLELSDRFSHHHHHLTCTSCGRIINTEEDSKLENAIRELAKKHNFSLSGHQLEVQGLCEQCRVVK